ncbi:MAG TPA: hypothetical protein VF403_20780 [Kofleriaceae bacterium]
MKLALIAVASFATLGQARLAHAISACSGESGWSGAGAEVPPHAHLVYWTNSRDDDEEKGLLIAKIDGKKVATKLTKLSSAPNTLYLIEIDSNASGKLQIRWSFEDQATSYKVTAKPAYAKEAHAKTSRYHSKLAHSTVREVFDGLAIAVDVPAMRAHVKLRRDSKAAWFELDVPVGDNRTIRIGELGCAQNYNPQLLENGVDLEVTLSMPDNTTVGVAGLTRAQIPKLPTPTSQNPWDGE